VSSRRPFRATPVKLGPHYRAKRRAKLARELRTVALTLVGAVFAGLALTGAMHFAAGTASASGSTISSCRVVDGDTLRCGVERVRLLGIDAPELPGHCAVGRNCAPGDPYESSRSLRDGMGDGSTLRIERVGTDRYGRTLALVAGLRGDLSCWQLKHAQAIYKPAWDDDGRVARICPDMAQ
jgi:endonuclease YncB( thermonuclease family)